MMSVIVITIASGLSGAPEIHGSIHVMANIEIWWGILMGFYIQYSVCPEA